MCANNKKVGFIQIHKEADLSFICTDLHHLNEGLWACAFAPLIAEELVKYFCFEQHGYIPYCQLK
ncbi:hypothetical protein EAS68_00515 [Legionella jordanis]|nr:hypothetical protein EAS68_00515 [Legionella jordanis]